MSRQGDSREQRKARTRLALIAAASELFDARGYLATTVDDIAARAGYTKGAFYAHFRDKADAFNTVLDQHAAARFDELDATLDEADMDNVFETVLAWIHDSFAQPPLERAQSEFYATAFSDPDERARLAARVTAMRDTVTTMIDRYCGQANVTLPLATMDLAAMIMAYVEGATRLQRLPVPQLPVTLVPDGLTFLWSAATSLPAD